MNKILELVVVRKQSLLKDGTGIVQILFTQNDAGEIEEPNINLFPTKSVWISIGYEKIEENFKEGELFIIDQYKETDRDSYIYDSVPVEGRSEHWARGTSTKRLDPSQYIPVINAELPDKGTGILCYKKTLPLGQFFILNNDYLYGPFSTSSTENETYAAPAQCLSLGLPNGSIAKMQIDILKKNRVFLSIANNEPLVSEIGYLTSLKYVAEVISIKDIEKIDYISDIQLINYFTKNGFGIDSKNVLGRKPAEQLKKAMEQQAKQNLASSGNERLERLTKVLDQYLNQPDPGHEIINNWLSTSLGKVFLKEFASDNPEIFESHTKELNIHRSNIEEDINRLILDKRKIEIEIQVEKSKVQKARSDASNEIEEIRKQTTQQQQEERQKLMADLEEKIQETDGILKEKEDNLKDVLNTLANANRLQDLTKEIEYKERRKEELTGAVKAQEGLLKSPDLSDEAIKTQTLLDLIHGRRFNRDDTPIIYSSPKLASSKPIDGNSIIQAMAEHFEDSGRSFTFEEMANLLVTIQQSFMTVLKGLPGAGKTSTAIRLAQAYHLANENGQGDDFLNVPISRGWVSGRDFIGFYNSLKSSYQPARTGMYQFLTNGTNKEAQNSLRLILLDEANLSPMEHYLSDFLGMFDSEGRSRPIDTGNPTEEKRFLKVPLNTRFIATINNDNTTEPLSPRLCDRVPIISMDLQELESTQIHTAFELDGVIPYGILEEFFGVQSAYENGYEDLPLKLVNAFELFEERNRELGQITVISKRKRMAMQVYFTVARRFMEETKAADFALSQYALPLVNGFGQSYKNRLGRVVEYAQRNNLIRSVDILEEIINSGDAHVGSYSFF